jgi:flagellar motility protein MotE (MotC chaperone)
LSLTIIEQNNLAELESTIERNLHAFYEVGFALMQIRDNKLYRESFTTFEAYCKEKWGMERNYANKLIQASAVVDNLGTIVPTPTNEAQARPLTHLEPDQQREAYQKAVETAPEGKVTAKHIEETVREMKGEMPEEPEEERESNELIWVKRAWRKLLKKDKVKFKKWLEENNG